MGASSGVMFSELNLQTIVSDYDSHYRMDEISIEMNSTFIELMPRLGHLR